MKKIIILLAGPNGAGKSTFYHTHLSAFAIPFVNADVVAKELDIDAYTAAALVEEERKRFIESDRSFIFETVLSDPHGAKIDFCRMAQARGYQIHAHFIGIDSPQTSQRRVMHRVAHQGHDVPLEKIIARYPRVMKNLERLIPCADSLCIYDNSETEHPHRMIAVFSQGSLTKLSQSLPAWISFLNLPALQTPSTTFLP